jgi:3-deoxy-manno-octulosonate cytidylyltransferase (CMP-KDO synthetase)
MARPIAVIPSRYAAQRFPGKPLALLLGLPMVQHVWARCVEAACFEQVIVATDDQRIAEVVKGFGGTVAMTSLHCASGSDRVAEVARGSRGDDDQVFFNVQGDEPAIHPESLSLLAKAFDDASVHMGTLIRPLLDDERTNSDVVKVVLDATGHALYFSRSDIPHQRDANHPSPPRWAHLGIYAYRKATLLRVAGLTPTALERAESLEQLRALAYGVRIACRVTPHSSVSVDRPEDLAGAEAAVKKLRPAV